MEDKEHEHHEHKHHKEHEHHKKQETVKFEITKVRIWQGLSAILAIIVLYMFFIGGGQPQFAPQQQQQLLPQQQLPPQQQQPLAPARLDNVDEDDDPFLGDKNAPVTIVSFEDYQCPFCKRAFDQTFPQLKKEYIDTGKVKFVFRDFPLSFHPEAQNAAEASECANEQGKFWEYHDALFNNQATLGSALYSKLAGDLSLDVDKFNSCLESGKYKQEVQDDFSYGSSVGVSGTPTFFINGVKLVGAQPFQAFQQVIDAELAK